MSGLRGLQDSMEVIAYDISTNEKVGEFKSISEAARKLFIRSKSAINVYLFGTTKTTFKGKKRGVSSYKSDIKYHFEIKQTNANPIQNT